MSSHFKEYQSENLTPKDFMPLRGKHYLEEVFFNHSIYNQISNSIKNNPFTLVLGNPISGKSRIVFDTLKKLENFRVFKADKKGINILPSYEFDQDMTNCIFIFDDIDEFYSNQKDFEKINNLLIRLIDNNIKTVIICRVGPEFKRFKKYCDKHIVNEISENYNSFLIPRFNKEYRPLKEFLESHRKVFRNDIKEFDGNIGSLIVPLSDMRKRFEELLVNEKKLPLAILLGLKLHYNLYNYEQTKKNYNIENIQFFCKKYLNLDRIDLYDWNIGIQILIESRTDLNFINVTDTINVEEVYLDIFDNKEDVIYDEFNKKRLLSLLNSLYTLYEKEVCKFPLNTYDLNEKIRQSSSFEDGLEIFHLIDTPNSYSFTNLMGLTDDTEKIVHLYDIMRNENRVDEFFIPHNIVINKFHSFGDLFKLLLHVNSKQLKTKNGTTNRLIKLAQIEPKQSLELLFEKINIDKIYSNPAYNDIVLRCVEDDIDYKKYIQPILPKIHNFDKNLRKNIIKACIKTRQYNNAIILINEYLTGYDRLNELGNCFLYDDSVKSLKFYEQALLKAELLTDYLKAHININRVIYYNKLQNEYFELVVNSNIFLKSNYRELVSDVKARNLKYLVKYLILNEITTLEDDNEIIKRFKYLSTRYYISNTSLSLALKEIQIGLRNKIMSEVKITIDNK